MHVTTRSIGVAYLQIWTVDGSLSFKQSRLAHHLSRWHCFAFFQITTTAAAIATVTANRAVVERIVAVVRLLLPLLLESGPTRPLVVSRIPTVPPSDPSSVPPLFTEGAIDGYSLGTLLGASLGARLGWSDVELLGSALGLLLGESEVVIMSISTGVMLGTVLGASLKVSLPGDENGVLVHFEHCGIGPASGMELSVCNKDRNLGFRKAAVSVIVGTPFYRHHQPLSALTFAHRLPLSCDGIRCPIEANVCQAPHSSRLDARSTRVQATAR
jgi:hypothetical protein